MRKTIEADKWLFNFLFELDTDFSEKYKKGIEQNVMAYIKKKYSSAITNKNGNIYIDEEQLGVNFCREYFKKMDCDYSAKDFANAALNRIGIPPKEAMSEGSLEKLIRDLFNSEQYNEKVYVKIVQGGKNVACLDRSLLDEIVCNKDVASLIEKQIAKAECNHDDNVAWKRYAYEKAHLQMIDDRIKEYEENEIKQDADIHNDASVNDKSVHDVDIQRIIGELYSIRMLAKRSFLIVDSLFSMFFTDFDFDKYDADVDSIENLESATDFGEEYQQLCKTLMSPNFDWKYYQPKDENQFLDVIAEKVAEKIIKKLSEKES